MQRQRRLRQRLAHIAQLVEHILGKNEVSGSSPDVGSGANEPGQIDRVHFVCDMFPGGASLAEGLTVRGMSASVCA